MGYYKNEKIVLQSREAEEAALAKSREKQPAPVTLEDPYADTAEQQPTSAPQPGANMA